MEKPSREEIARDADEALRNLRKCTQSGEKNVMGGVEWEFAVVRYLAFLEAEAERREKAAFEAAKEQVFFVDDRKAHLKYGCRYPTFEDYKKSKEVK